MGTRPRAFVERSLMTCSLHHGQRCSVGEVWWAQRWAQVGGDEADRLRVTGEGGGQDLCGVNQRRLREAATHWRNAKWPKVRRAACRRNGDGRCRKQTADCGSAASADPADQMRSHFAGSCRQSTTATAQHYMRWPGLLSRPSAKTASQRSLGALSSRALRSIAIQEGGKPRDPCLRGAPS